MSVAGYGIDFGTSNSAISIAYDDEIEVLEIEPRAAIPTMLPSTVYLSRDRNRLAGNQAVETFMVTGRDRHKCSSCDLVSWSSGVPHTACRTYTHGGGCMDSRLLSGLKRDLADVSFARTHSWATDFAVPELIAVAIKRLKQAADRRTGENVKRAVFGYPLAFPGTEGAGYSRAQGLAINRLGDAAHEAGFEEVEWLPEPQAAAIVEETDSGVVLAVDFGGGTFDVAVIEFDEDRAEVTALQGAAIGGELIDGDIFEQKVAPLLGMDATFPAQSGARLGMPATMRKQFRNLSGIKHLMYSNDVGVWLREHAARPGGAPLSQLEELLYGGQAYSFYRAVEQAKIDLSATDATSIIFRRTGINVQTDFTRRELDAIVAPYLEQIDQCISDALKQASVSDSQLESVVATGGSSQLASFKDYLDARFGSGNIVQRDPYNTVVTGLGYEAQGRWGR